MKLFNIDRELIIENTAKLLRLIPVSDLSSAQKTAYYYRIFFAAVLNQYLKKSGKKTSSKKYIFAMTLQYQLINPENLDCSLTDILLRHTKPCSGNARKIYNALIDLAEEAISTDLSDTIAAAIKQNKVLTKKASRESIACTEMPAWRCAAAGGSVISDDSESLDSSSDENSGEDSDPDAATYAKNERNALLSTLSSEGILLTRNTYISQQYTNKLNMPSEASNSLYKSTDGNHIKFYDSAYNNADYNSGAFTDIIASIKNLTEYNKEHKEKGVLLIEGWQIDILFTLHPEGEASGKESIQQLLTDAADAGTPVYILCNNQAFGDHNTLIHNFSETHSNIHCEIISQASDAPQKGSSHHGKSVTVLYPENAAHASRSFIGGLDLAKKRADISTWSDSTVQARGPVVAEQAADFSKRWRNKSTDNSLSETLHSQEMNYHTSDASDSEDSSSHSTFKLQLAAQRTSGDHTSNPGEIHRDIYDAHVRFIQSAQHHILICNQFLSGYGYDHIDSANQIPKVIIEKIIDKASRGEAFSVDIMLPFNPQVGDITGEEKLVGAIHRHQWKSIKLMIDEVKEAFEVINTQRSHAMKAPLDPNNYLSFYAKGQFKDNRFVQTYIHDKVMLVDDEKFIVGSANLNERSMSGSRDTERAIVGQATTAADKAAIKAFRLQKSQSFWGERTSENASHFDHPETAEAGKFRREQARGHWETKGAESASRAVPFWVEKHNPYMSKNGIASKPKRVPKSKSSLLKIAGGFNDTAHNFLR